MEAIPENHKTCPSCSGTGDLAAFRGESRFLLTHEECPFCCGFGYVLEEEKEDRSDGRDAARPTGAE